MNWKDYLTPDEATRLAILAQRKAAGAKERAVIHNRAKQRMVRAAKMEIIRGE